MRFASTLVLALLIGACSVYDNTLGGSGGGGTAGKGTSGDTVAGSGGSTSVGAGGEGATGATGDGGATSDGGESTGVGGASSTSGGNGGTDDASTKAGATGSTGVGGAGGSAGKSSAGGASAMDAAGGSGLGGASSGKADAAGEASVRGDAGAACPEGTCKRVFVSAAVPVPSGKLGGVGGADIFCQQAADASQLGGIWKAWLSDTSSSPSARFTHATVPYRLLDGSTIAADWTALTSGALAHAINVFEDGTAVQAGVILEVWTGTTVSGTYSGNACANWTNDTATPPIADVGLSNQTNAGWTHQYQQYCNRTTIHVYCFEQ